MENDKTEEPVKPQHEDHNEELLRKLREQNGRSDREMHYSQEYLEWERQQ